MLPGVHGRLVTTSFAREVLPSLDGAEPVPAATARAITAWWRRCDTSLGPASGARAVADVALLPLLRLLGYDPCAPGGLLADGCLTVSCGDACNLSALAVPWNEPLGRGWRAAVLHAVTRDASWCLCCSGTALRIVDARRTWSREYLEFDLRVLPEDPAAQSLLWSVARLEAMRRAEPVLDRAVALSARHGVEVCRALGDGVLRALEVLLTALSARSRGRYAAETLLEHSLTVLYRLLFLLFAEARTLVPMWHPLYRDRYSLAHIVDVLSSGRQYRGLWQALLAISRLAHAGCSAGELTVTAFNGRLFSPAHAASFARGHVDDGVLGRAVMAVTTTEDRSGRRARIAYRDLDVEQLGAVYERVLEYEPAASAGAPLVRTRDRRKATGTFYTPRPVTRWLVRQALEPLLAGRDSDGILRLRVLDPAMGSGAFLVAACRHLAEAMEEALIREGRWHAHDVTPADRALLRREIAARCLFGVDVNPMAVQLARLSLWLATLAADRPLSFLDHHLLAGDSLVGAAPADLLRQPGGSTRAVRRAGPLPLLGDADVTPALREGVRVRLQLSVAPDDSAATVHAKEQTLGRLQHHESPLGRWSRLLDLWCAGWFWEEGPAPDRGTSAALEAHILRGQGPLPVRTAEALLERAAAVAGRWRFLHWPLAFPEVFVDAEGGARTDAGFDAVLGNPPWDMVRGDSGDGAARGGRRADAQRLTAFVRESGIYRVETRAHANRYQLFVERALQLVRPGGRIGLVLPGGIATDAGVAPLRRHLFDRAGVDTMTGLDNREGIFPIHRSVRFVLLTATAGRPTEAIRCRFGITQPDRLDHGETAPLVLSRRLLSRLSGEDDLGVPELGAEIDLRIVERVASTVPRLGAAAGWGAHFGRELNATDDRAAFAPFTGDPTARPIVEGKQLEPFRVALDRARLQLRRDADARVPRRVRLAYRDVASATNRLTLIAAVVPARAATTHTVFCLKTPLTAPAQHVLCALLNSYVANYLVRLRVNTHVTAALVSRLPVPVVRPPDAAFDRLLSLARALQGSSVAVEDMPDYARLQAIVATLYGLTREEFAHVLTTFPLVPAAVRSRVLEEFSPLERDRQRG